MSANSDQSSAYVLTPPDQIFPLTRHFSYWLTPVLMRTPLTPNQVTALSLLAGLGGACGFAQGTWIGGVWGGALLVLCYTLDNCDGEIARLKKLSSEWGAHFDDVVDWLVDGAFFAALGYGTYVATGNIIWLWLGLAATAGATIDYGIDLILNARARNDPAEKSREQEATDVRKPEDWRDWLIYIFHKLSRADFCVIVLTLAVFDIAWILVPLGAIGAQAYWITDLFKRARGWHT
ncbi:MAG: CDP-alcohol phosphatidyltransferase family protein [Rhodospirillaceae bacterium]|nr:CDP-alcohol phosphatidyltransferase family protein [Rhodospirillaceae bacterium]MBT5458592.1 CDP-alcohol phosphatidyltransferase family protein [Rhodospirillaceae bacterium]